MLVTATITSGTGTGALASATATTGVNGQATFSGLKVTGTLGTYILTFTSGSAFLAASSFTLTAGAATTVAINTQPTGAVDGVALTGQPVVTVTDTNGDPVDGVLVTATITSGTGTGALASATATTGVNGQATFSGLKVTGTLGTYILTFTSGSAFLAASSFTLTIGAASIVTVSTQPSGAATGTAMSGPPVILVTDVGGNPIDGDLVTATIESGAGSITAGATATTGSNGDATFTGLTITGTAGTYELTFTESDGAASGNSGTFSLATGVATTLTVDTEPTGAVDGVALTGQPVVTVVDAETNPIDGDTVTATITGGTGDGFISAGGTAITGSNGEATFSGLTITGAPWARTYLRSPAVLLHTMRPPSRLPLARRRRLKSLASLRRRLTERSSLVRRLFS